MIRDAKAFSGVGQCRRKKRKAAFGQCLLWREQFYINSLARTEAIVAAGGPVIGSAGALACLAVGLSWESKLFLALAYTGCLLNLFNLIPMYPLDGGRIVTAISPKMWLIGIPILLIGAIKFINPIIILFGIMGGVQAYRTWKSTDKSYFAVSPQTRLTFTTLYFGLMLVLGVVMAYVHGLYAPTSNF